MKTKEKAKPVNLRITKWIRTNDKRGLKPTFDVICHHCNEEMILRNSELASIRVNALGRAQVVQTLRIMYKCVSCAQVYWFHVSHPYVDNDYWNKVLTWRDNHPLYVPPVTEWDDNAKIQQRLKAIGYWGGDITEGTTELEEK